MTLTERRLEAAEIVVETALQVGFNLVRLQSLCMRGKRDHS